MPGRPNARTGRAIATAVAAIVAAAALWVLPAFAGGTDPDPTFGQGGVALDTGVIGLSDLAIQSDGRLVAAGSARHPLGSTPQFSVTRYLPTGARDASFATDGRHLSIFTGPFADSLGARAATVSIQPDGRIVAAGTAPGEIVVERLMPDGSRDTSFNPSGSTPGQLTSTLGGEVSPSVSGMVLDAAGRILVAGTSRPSGGADRVFVARLTPGGAFDAAFASGSPVTGVRFQQLGSGGGSAAAAVTLDGEGRVVVGGTAYQDGRDQFAFARFSPAGAFEGAAFASFRTAAGISGRSEARDVAVDGAGRVVLAGSTTEQGGERVAVARFLEGGTFDASFGDDATPGRVAIAYGQDGDSAASAVHVDGDGRAVLAGYAAEGSRRQVLIARLTGAGAPDPSFGDGADHRLLPISEGAEAFASGLVALPAGRRVLAGKLTEGDGGQAGFLTKLGGTSASPTADLTVWQPSTSSTGRTHELRPGRVVRFDSAPSKDPDGTIVQREWDLDGNGTFDESGDTVQTVFQPGKHTVTLRVTDNEGLRDTSTRVLNVVPNAKPIPRVASVTPSPVHQNVVTTIDASASSDPDGDAVRWVWDLDGNGTWDRDTTEPTVKHKFPHWGDLTIRVAVFDDEALQSAPLIHHVQVKRPVFSLRWLPIGDQDTDAVVLTPGGSATTDVALERGPGSIEPVWVGVQPQAGLKGTAEPNPLVSANDRTRLHITAGKDTKPGIHLLKVTGEYDPSAGSQPAELTIKVKVVTGADARLEGIEVNQVVQIEHQSCHVVANLEPDKSPMFECGTRRSLPPPQLLGGRPTVGYRGVPLVRGKRTVVRVYGDHRLRDDGQEYDVRLELYDAGLNGGAAKKRASFMSTSGPRKLRKDSGYNRVPFRDRAQPENAWTFVLPFEWQLTSTSVLRAVLLPKKSAVGNAPGECSDPQCAQNNEFELRGVRFRRTGRIRVALVRLFIQNEDRFLRNGDGTPATAHPHRIVSFPNQGTEPHKRLPAPRSVMSLAELFAPLAEGSLEYAPFYRAAMDMTHLGSIMDATERRAQARDELDAEADKHDGAASCGGQPGEFCAQQVLGIMSPQIDTGGRSIGTIQDSFWSDPVAVAPWSRPITVAHEMFHGWAAGHSHDVEDCNGLTGLTQLGSSPDPAQWGFVRGLGLDTRPGQPGTTKAAPFRTVVPSALVGPGNDSPSGAGRPMWVIDLMSYCRNENERDRWIAPEIYTSLMSAAIGINGEKPLGPTEAVYYSRPRQVAEVLAVRGYDGAGGAGITTVGRRRSEGRPPASRYVVRALNAFGQVTHEAPMPAERVVEDGSMALEGEVPAGAAGVAIARDGTEIARRVASSSAPAVRLRSPRAGARITAARRSVEVAWRARDADGDRVVTSIDLSTDGGRTFRPIGRTAAQRMALDREMFSSSRRARIRLRAGDGFHETTVVSPSFRIDARPPSVQITSPTRRDRPAAGSALVLSGRVVDEMGRRVPDRRLRWYVGRRGVGRGAQASVAGLAPGRYTVRLVARDGHGRRGVAARRVRVASAPPRLTVFRVPRRLSRNARRLTVRVAATYPTTLRLLGRRFRVGTRPRTLRLRVARGRRPVVLRVRVGAGRSSTSDVVPVNRR